MKLQNETAVLDAFTVDKIIDVYYVVVTPYKMKHNNPLVCFDYWQLLYLDKGRYTCSVDDTLFSLRAGQVMLCAPGGKRCVVAQENACVAYISFRCASEKMDLLKDRVLSLTVDQRRLVSRIFSVGIEHFENMEEQDQYYGQQVTRGTTDLELQTIKNSLELLLIELADLVQSRPLLPIADNRANYYSNQFEKIEQYMKQHIAEQITIDSLASAMGIGMSTVKRAVNQCAGIGVIQYFNILKIKEAQRMIRDTDKTMTQISEDLGFSSIHYFSRLFKVITGKAPSQYGKAIVKNQ